MKRNLQYSTTFLPQSSVTACVQLTFDYENIKMLLCHCDFYAGNYLAQYAKNTGDTKKPGFGGEFLKSFKPNNFFFF